MNGRRLLPLLGLLLVLPVAAFAQEKADSPAEAGVCTPDNPPAHLEIEGLLTDEDRTALRSRVGLANLGPEDAEVLADPEDSDICARLRRLVPRGYRTGSSQEFWQFTYFRVSDRYVITMELDIEPGQRPPVLTRQQTIVVNEDLGVVAEKAAGRSRAPPVVRPVETRVTIGARFRGPQGMAARPLRR